jgi:hypothetical protein
MDRGRKEKKVSGPFFLAPDLGRPRKTDVSARSIHHTACGANRNSPLRRIDELPDIEKKPGFLRRLRSQGWALRRISHQKPSFCVPGNRFSA